MIKNVLFDLDGTISDSSPGIFDSIGATLSWFGKEVPDEAGLRQFIGPPTEVTFSKFFPKEEVTEVVAFYRNYYLTSGAIFMNEMYDGIEALLHYLKKLGYKVFVATTKEINATKRVLKLFGIDELLDGAYGVDLEKGILNKTMVIEQICEENGLNKEETILVGDTMYDVVGAREAGVKIGIVMYGFGERQTMLDVPAEFHAETAEELQDYFK